MKMTPPWRGATEVPSRRALARVTAVARPVLLAPFMKMTTATARTKANPGKTTATAAPKPRAKRVRISVARRNEYVTKYYTCVEKVARRLARRLPSHVDIDDLMS